MFIYRVIGVDEFLQFCDDWITERVHLPRTEYLERGTIYRTFGIPDFLSSNTDEELISGIQLYYQKHIGLDNVKIKYSPTKNISFIFGDRVFHYCI